MAEEKVLSIVVKTKVQDANLTKLKKAITEDEIALKKLRKEINKSGKASNTQAKEMAALEARLKGNRNAYRDLQAEILKANGALRKNSGFVQGIKKGVSQVATNILALVAAFSILSSVVGSTFKTIADFDQAQADLAAVLGKSEKEIKELTAASKALGSSTAFTATQVSELQKEFAKLGFEDEDILKMTEATLNLAAASGTDLARAAEVTGSTLRAFGLEADQTTRLTDVMAKSFSTSSLDMEKFATAMANVGPIAAQSGVSLEETTALIGVLTDNGLDASTAGTGLRNVFLELSKQGITLNQALTKIRNSSNQNATAMELFGKRGATIGTILSKSGDKANELADGFRNAGGAAEKMANTQLDTLSGQTKLLQSAWEGFLLSLEDGDGIIAQSLRNIMNFFTQVLNGLTKLTQSSEQAMQSRLNASKEFIQNSFSESFQALTDASAKSTKQLEEDLKHAEGVEKDGIRAILESRKQGLKDTDAIALRLENLRIKNLDRQREKTKELEQAEKDLAAAKESGDNMDAARAAFRRQKLLEGLNRDKTAIDSATQELNSNLSRRSQENLEALASSQNLVLSQLAQEEIERRSNVTDFTLEEIDNVSQAEQSARNKKLQEEQKLAEKIRQLKIQTETEEGTQERAIAEEFARYEAEQARFQSHNEVLQLLEKEHQQKMKAISDEFAMKKMETIGIEVERELELRNTANQEIQEQAEVNSKFQIENLRNTIGGISDLAGALSEIAGEGTQAQKALALTSAILNTALGVTLALADPTPIPAPVRLINAATVAAVGGAQIATIVRAEQGTVVGGSVLSGPRHSGGGVNMLVNGIPTVNAEGGEAVINRRSTKMFGPELSAINQAGGGRPLPGIPSFASGGVTPTPSISTSSQTSTQSLSSGFMDVADQMGRKVGEIVNGIMIVNNVQDTFNTGKQVMNTENDATFG